MGILAKEASSGPVSLFGIKKTSRARHIPGVPSAVTEKRASIPLVEHPIRDGLLTGHNGFSASS